jgi:hypothetical protein
LMIVTLRMKQDLLQMNQSALVRGGGGPVTLVEPWNCRMRKPALRGRNGLG